jgi:hypothetical protein
MNTEDFIMYAVLGICMALGTTYLLWDAWRDREADRRGAE